jgi:hypothetical protein
MTGMLISVSAEATAWLPIAEAIAMTLATAAARGLKDKTRPS